MSIYLSRFRSSFNSVVFIQLLVCLLAFCERLRDDRLRGTEMRPRQRYRRIFLEEEGARRYSERQDRAKKATEFFVVSD